MEVSRQLDLFGLISLDQEKAFDLVEHKYLWKTLKAFGFSPGFIALTKTLYCDIESVLKVNGGLSAPFTIVRGIRQGCAMSGMLYSIAIEPMLCQIRKRLEGIKIGEGFSPLHLSAYADDIMVAVNSERGYRVFWKNLLLQGKLGKEYSIVRR